ncbi:hypothetical protein Taro_049456, partial [Colocasia esculenta]|nr:hypothetical protein [Colocasia esculenta]
MHLNASSPRELPCIQLISPSILRSLSILPYFSPPLSVIICTSDLPFPYSFPSLPFLHARDVSSSDLRQGRLPPLPLSEVFNPCPPSAAVLPLGLTTTGRAGCNLLSQTTTILNRLFYWTWRDVLESLKSCEPFLDSADESDLLQDLRQFGDPTDDGDGGRRPTFKATVKDETGALKDWASGGPCLGGRAGNWTGVYCKDDKVIKLKLEYKSLSGTQDLDVLADLTALRSISFMNNHLEGFLPNVHSLSRLRRLYLAHNKFSGTIADDSFSGMGTLRARTTPSPLALAPRLIELNLAENGLTGTLPDFDQGGKLALNVSFNNLEGPIPASLSRLDKSLFQVETIYITLAHPPHL